MVQINYLRSRFSEIIRQCNTNSVKLFLEEADIAFLETNGYISSISTKGCEKGQYLVEMSNPLRLCS